MYHRCVIYQLVNNAFNDIFCVPTCFHMRIPKPFLSVCPYNEKINHHSFVNISPTLVIDTSIALQVLVVHHGSNISTCSRRISFTRLVIIPWYQGKKFLLSCFVNNFYLILCTLIGAIILSINIQVGLDMHLYDDIGDASSSLRGSTSSWTY